MKKQQLFCDACKKLIDTDHGEQRYALVKRHAGWTVTARITKETLYYDGGGYEETPDLCDGCFMEIVEKAVETYPRTKTWA